ncbi:MAG: hypothetical protein ABIU20_09710 [Blastocatellia bacterium]
MNTSETAVSQNIQQAVIENLTLLSLEKQQQVLDFTEELAQAEQSGQTFWEMAQECIKDVPPEAFDELPTDGALNHDHYLYGAPKK